MKSAKPPGARSPAAASSGAKPAASAQPPNLGFLINDIARVIGVIYARRMGALQLTRSQWELLGYIARCPGMYQGELADLVGVTRMTVTGLLDRLEAKALIERQSDPSDRRLKRVFLTPQAKAQVPELQQVANILTGQVLQGLTRTERRTLFSLLLRVQANAVGLLAPVPVPGNTDTDAE